MTAPKAAAAPRDPWALRLAIGVYPAWWQERYGEDAAATIADVAATRRALPVRDLVGLLARGVALRARTSMVFWLGATLIALEILTTATSSTGFRVERIWGTVLVHSGWGVIIAIPIVAASAAWLARDRAVHRNGSVRSRLAGLGRDAAVVLGFAALGYLSIVVLTLIGSGWPAPSSFDLGYTAGFAAMTTSAFAVGSLLGGVLPRWIAFPGAIVLALLAMVSDGWQNGELRWRNVTGSSLTFDADYGTLGTSNPHIIVVTAAYAGTLALAAIMVTALARRGLRAIAVMLTFVVVVAGSATIATPLLNFVGSHATSFRSNTQLQCSGTDPRICLWPEQDATDGPALRAMLAAAYKKTGALGYPLTHSLSAGALDPEAGTAIGVDNSTRFDPDRAIVGFASGVIEHGACSKQPAHILQGNDQQAAEYGLAFLLGSETRDHLGIHNRAQAKAAVDKWFAERAYCGNR